MKHVVLAILILLIPGLISPGFISTVSADKKADKAASHDVSIKDMKYNPDSLQIAVGDTVVWTNNDNHDHTVIAADKSFKSDKLGNGDTYQFTFKKAGKFSYSCSYHPRMKGEIIVVGGN